MPASTNSRISGRNVIIAGLPRSGTTLVCHLLNEVPDVVALNEPMIVGTFFNLDIEQVMNGIGAFFDECRASIINQSLAPSKVVDGRVPDNPFLKERDADGARIRQVALGRLRIDRPLTSDFILAMKHPAMFTSLLVPLCARFPCWVVIRNPLATLLSWDSLPDTPMGSGRFPAAEAFDSRLKAALDAMPDRLDRHVYFLEWAFGRYLQVGSRLGVLAYEDIIASNGRALSAISQQAYGLNADLRNENLNVVYRRDAVEPIARALLARNGSWKQWYPDDAIEQLAEALLAGHGR